MNKDIEKNQAKAVVEIWCVLSRYRWRFVLPAFVVMAMVLAAGMVMPRKYRAEAIFDQKTDPVLAEISLRGASKTYQDPKQALVEEVAGRPAIAALRKNIDPILSNRIGPHWQGRDAFYSDLTRSVVIRKDIADRDQNRVRVEYVGTDPVIAREVVNGLVENYIQQTRSEIEKRLRQTANFLREEADRYSQEIEVLENKLLAFEIENDLLLPDHPAGIQMVLAERELALTEAETRHQSALEMVDGLVEELDRTPPTIPQIVRGRNPRLEELQSKLRAAEAKLVMYVGEMKMTEKHPDLIALREQIEAMREELTHAEDQVVTETHEGQNPKRAELETRLTTARAEARAAETGFLAAKKSVTELNSKMGRLYPVRTEHRRLTGAIETARRNLYTWQDNLRRVEMSMAAETGDRGVQLEFIKPCGELHYPVSPNLSQVLAASVLLGILAGSLSVFMAHRTDESFADGDALAETFNLPLIGSVSEIITQQQARVRRLRNMIFYPVHAGTMATVLIGMSTLLYLNLERPQQYEALTSDPSGFILNQLFPQPEEKEPVAFDVPMNLLSAPLADDELDRDPRVLSLPVAGLITDSNGLEAARE